MDYKTIISNSSEKDCAHFLDGGSSQLHEAGISRFNEEAEKHGLKHCVIEGHMTLDDNHLSKPSKIPTRNMLRSPGSGYQDGFSLVRPMQWTMY